MKKESNRKIKVKPKPDRVGYIIPIPGFGRFQPMSKDDYLILPAKAKEAAKKSKDVIVEEIKNG